MTVSDVPGHFFRRVLFLVRVAVPGFPDGLLRDHLHDVAGLLACSRHRRDRTDRSHLPGALQGAHQGPIAHIQDILHLGSHFNISGLKCNI